MHKKPRKARPIRQLPTGDGKVDGIPLRERHRNAMSEAKAFGRWDRYQMLCMVIWGKDAEAVARRIIDDPMILGAMTFGGVPAVIPPEIAGRAPRFQNLLGLPSDIDEGR